MDIDPEIVKAAMPIIISVAGPTLLAFLATVYGWIQGEIKTRDLLRVLERCGTDNEELKRNAIEIGANAAFKAMMQRLK